MVVKHKSIYLTKQNKNVVEIIYLFDICLHQEKNSRFSPAHLKKNFDLFDV